MTALRKRSHHKSAVSRPLVVTCGIYGVTASGDKFPRWTARLIGRLAVTDAGLEWEPIVPWRRPKRVEVPWRQVRQISLRRQGCDVSAEGWTQLFLAPSRRKKFDAALLQAGFFVREDPASPGDYIATPSETTDDGREHQSIDDEK